MIKMKTPSALATLPLRHDVILAAREATEAVIASAPLGSLAIDDPIRMANKVFSAIVASLPHEHVKLDEPQDPATVVRELFKAMGLAPPAGTRGEPGEKPDRGDEALKLARSSFTMAETAHVRLDSHFRDICAIKDKIELLRQVEREVRSLGNLAGVKPRKKKAKR